MVLDGNPLIELLHCPDSFFQFRLSEKDDRDQKPVVELCVQQQSNLLQRR